MLIRLLLNPAPVEGNGTPETKPEAAPDLGKAAEALIAKHGDASQAVRVLLGETFNYRDQLRETKAKLPPEGAKVLTGDDAKHWDAYKALGTPADLKRIETERHQFATEAAGFRKAELIAEAATLHGFRPSVLKTLAKDVELSIVETTGKDGKPVREAIIKGEGDATIKLVDHAAKSWGDFLPSLKAEAPRTGGSPALRGGAPAPSIAPEAQAQRPRLGRI